MADAVLDGPVGDDWQPVVSEVMEYWRAWMRRSGNFQGLNEGSSPAFVSEGDVGGEVPAAAEGVPSDGAVPKGSSDYDEHQMLLDARVSELRVLMAMMLARGVRFGGVS